MQGLERLHYFNGQRLAAKDLEVEQTYHMRVRRLLNRGLYTAGVITGLEVLQVDSRHVRVKGGVALDAGGREVILLGDATLAVPNRRPSSALPGFFLVIRYDEETEPGDEAHCKESSGTTPPARIREAPLLSWTETWPNHDDCGKKGHAADCAVVLALVALDASCQIERIDTSVRQWSRSAVPRQVAVYALEGEKDIDAANPKRLHFQIRGGEPQSVLLYLWADAISSLFYTELGSHDHGLTRASSSPVPLVEHRHDLSGIRTGPSDPLTHRHLLNLSPNITPPHSGPDWISRITRPLVGPNYEEGNPPYVFDGGAHTHLLSASQTGLTTGVASGTQTLTLTGRADPAGATAPAAGTRYQARGGPAHGYPSGLRVKLDGTDITGLILGRLGWTSLGNGTGGHPLVTSGTGGIDLIELGLGFVVGGHELEFRVPGGGGKVLYNLYVE